MKLEDLDLEKVVKAIPFQDTMVNEEEDLEMLPEGDVVEEEVAVEEAPAEGLSAEEAKSMLEEMAPLFRQAVDGLSMLLDKLGVEAPEGEEMTPAELTDLGMVKLNELMLRPTIDKVKEQQEKIAMSDKKVKEQEAKTVVQKFVDEGKIADSNVDWAVGYCAKIGVQAFSDLYRNAPQMVPTSEAIEDIKEPKKEDKIVKFAFSDFQRKIMKNLNLTDEEGRERFDPNYKKPENKVKDRE